MTIFILWVVLSLFFFLPPPFHEVKLNSIFLYSHCVPFFFCYCFIDVSVLAYPAFCPRLTFLYHCCMNRDARVFATRGRKKRIPEQQSCHKADQKKITEIAETRLLPPSLPSLFLLVRQARQQYSRQTCRIHHLSCLSY